MDIVLYPVLPLRVGPGGGDQLQVHLAPVPGGDVAALAGYGVYRDVPGRGDGADVQPLRREQPPVGQEAVEGGASVASSAARLRMSSTYAHLLPSQGGLVVCVPSRYSSA